MTDKAQVANLTPGVNLNTINPLIGNDGDTSHVQSVLGLVSKLMIDATDGSIEFSYDHARGFASLLDTCKAALEAMQKEGGHHG